MAARLRSIVLVTLASLLIVAPVAAGAGDGGEPVGQVTITLVDGSGSPLAGAVVAVFLDDPGAGASHRIGHGVTDAHGRFSMRPGDDSTVAAQARLSPRRLVGAEVKWFHEGRRLLGWWPFTFTLGADHVERIDRHFGVSEASAAHFDRDEFVAAPWMTTGAGPGGWNGDDKVIGRKKKPVKIATLHLSRGFRGGFRYKRSEERESQIETAFAGCHWSRSCDWSVGGFHVESKTKGGRTVSHSLTRNGPFHRTMRPVYRLFKYKWCAYRGEANGPDDCDFVKKKWKMMWWTGGLNIDYKASKKHPLKGANGFPMEVGQRFATTDAKNQTYDFGLALAGFEIGSQGGYSDITRLWWKVPTKKCDWNYLWGRDTDAARAEAIYTRSRGCG